jgi:hypothetical protein
MTGNADAQNKGSDDSELNNGGRLQGIRPGEPKTGSWQDISSYCRYLDKRPDASDKVRRKMFFEP